MSWPSVRLAEVATIERKGIDPSEIASGTEYIGLEHIESGGRLLGSQTVVNGELASTKFHFGPNHILYGKLRPYLAKIAMPDFEGVCSTDILPINPGTCIDRKFLAYFLRQPSMVDLATSRSIGANLPRLSPKVLANFEILLPPLEEQKRIAAILDQADSLRRLRQRAIDRLNTLGQAIFYEMFGDPLRNDKGWPTVRLGDLVKIRRGGSPRPIEKYLGGNVPWIKIGDATKGDEIYIRSTAERIHESGLNKTVYLKKGSLIFANCGVSLGFARILEIDGCIHDGWLSLEEIPEHVLSKIFLLKLINIATLHFRRIAPAGTQPNLNTTIMKNFVLVLPDRSVQGEFEERLEKLRAVDLELTDASDKANRLFSSLQHRAFRGEL